MPNTNAKEAGQVVQSKRLNQLLAMTRSPNEHEARNAAMKACALLLEAGFPDAEGEQAERLRKDLYVAQRQAEYFEAKLLVVLEELKEYKKPKPKPSPARGLSDDLEVVARFYSNYSSTCRTCGKRINVGEYVAWHGKGRGCSCDLHY